MWNISKYQQRIGLACKLFEVKDYTFKMAIFTISSTAHSTGSGCRLNICHRILHDMFSEGQMLITGSKISCFSVGPSCNK